tara:strand:+ start:1498 stop:1701 length:204 start_codon:yes stop_codon:yes gene_type:complete
MTPFQIHLQGQKDPILVELDCLDVEQLSELASQARFVIGHLIATDEYGCQPRIMIAASRISCAIEHN